MAKQGGSLVANTNAEVLAANEQRSTVMIINPSGADTIYYEFGAAASTTSTDDSFVLPPGSGIVLHKAEFPEIVKSVNLKSTGTPQYFAAEGLP